MKWPSNPTRQKLYDTALAIATAAVVFGFATERQALALVAITAPWLLMARSNVK